MTTRARRHVVFGTGAIGLATLDALRARGERVRMVNRSGSAAVPDDVEVVGGDAGDPAFATAVTEGARVVYQTLNRPYHLWEGSSRPLQASVLAAARTHEARLVSVENVYMYRRPNGRPLAEDRGHDAHTRRGRLRSTMSRELLEMQYQFEEPFIVDSTAFTARLGTRATPVDEAVEKTLATYRTPAP